MMPWRPATAVVALALGLAACGGSSGGKSSVTTQSQPTTSSGSSTAPTAPTSATQASTSDTIAGLTADDHGTKDVAGQSSVTINAGNYYFEPSVLKGTGGQKMTLTIKDEGSTAHNFTLPSQNINSDIDANKSVTVHVTLPSSGVLSFFCEYHKTKGMAGGLLVSGDKAAAPSSAQPSSSSGGGWG